MDFTISQLASAASHILRPLTPTANGLRASGPAASPVGGSTDAASLHGLETEYDQFGRFATTAAEEAPAAHSRDEPRQPVNPAAKYFSAGKVTVEELATEYRRSLIDSQVAEDEGGVRRFIPAGMTEYQVNQLSNYQYLWAIEAERRALARAEQERICPDMEASTPPAPADPAIR